MNPTSRLRRARLASSLVCLFACGAKDSTSVSGNEIDGSESASGSTSPTGDILEHCLSPDRESLTPATQAAICPLEEGVSGAIKLVYSTWPELVLDECSGGEVQVEAPCTVMGIVNSNDGAIMSSACLDDQGGLHVVDVRIESPALLFPICEGDVFVLNYSRVEFGCPNGGYRESLVIRESLGGRILCVSIEAGGANLESSFPESTLPLTLSLASEPGCEVVKFTCVESERKAVKISEGAMPPALVYDDTLRVINLSSQYVAEAHIVEEKAWNDCEQISRLRVSLVAFD